MSRDVRRYISLRTVASVIVQLRVFLMKTVLYFLCNYPHLAPRL